MKNILGALLLFVSSSAIGAIVGIDASDPANGLFDIYSATFDPPLTPGGDPFFSGTPPASRDITISPNPTGIINQTPGGFLVPPTSGSFLDFS